MFHSCCLSLQPSVPIHYLSAPLKAGREEQPWLLLFSYFFGGLSLTLAILLQNKPSLNIIYAICCWWIKHFFLKKKKKKILVPIVVIASEKAKRRCEVSPKSLAPGYHDFWLKDQLIPLRWSGECTASSWADSICVLEDFQEITFDSR